MFGFYQVSPDYLVNTLHDFITVKNKKLCNNSSKIEKNCLKS